jgi:HSP20 family protein
LEELEKRLSSRSGLGEREALTLAEWSPSVDITEDDKEYVIKADLPEVKKEDVKVRVDDGVLTVRGERKLEKEEKSKKYHRVERAYGSFARSFGLPEDAEGDKVRAEFKDGVLLVHLPKNPAAKPKAREIAIS